MPPYNHLLGSCSFDSGWTSWPSVAVCVQRSWRRFCTHREIRRDSVLVLEFDAPTRCCRGQRSHKMGKIWVKQVQKGFWDAFIHVCETETVQNLMMGRTKALLWFGHIPFYYGWSGAKSTDTHLHRSTCACARLEQQKQWARLIHTWQVGNPVRTRAIRSSAASNLQPAGRLTSVVAQHSPQMGQSRAETNGSCNMCETWSGGPDGSDWALLAPPQTNNSGK